MGGAFGKGNSVEKVKGVIIVRVSSTKPLLPEQQETIARAVCAVFALTRKTTAVCVFDASTVRADSEQTLMIEFKHVFNGGIRLVEVHAIWLVGVKEALPDLPVSKTVFRCDEDIPGFFSSTPPFCLAFEEEPKLSVEAIQLLKSFIDGKAAPLLQHSAIANENKQQHRTHHSDGHKLSASGNIDISVAAHASTDDTCIDAEDVDDDHDDTTSLVAAAVGQAAEKKNIN